MLGSSGPFLTHTLRGGNRFIRSIATSSVAIAASADSSTVYIWEGSTARSATPIDEHRSGIVALGWDRDAARLATGDRAGVVNIWGAPRWHHIATLRHDHPISALGWSPDDQFFASADEKGELRLWDAQTLGPYPSHHFSHRVNRLAWAPVETGAVCCCTLESGEVSLLRVHPRQVRDIPSRNQGAAFDPVWLPAGRLAVCFASGVVSVYSADKLTEITTLDAPGITAGMCFSAHAGVLAALSTTGYLTAWDAAGLKFLWGHQIGSPRPASRAIAAIPGSMSIAVTGEHEGEVQVWNSPVKENVRPAKEGQVDLGGPGDLVSASCSLHTPAVHAPTIVVLANAWGPLFGGINAFNEEFCRSIGSIVGANEPVRCVTTEGDEKVLELAARDGVKISTVDKSRFASPTALAEAALSELKSGGISEKIIVVGHDVITGAAALQLGNLLRCRTAIIHHMSYGSYQAVRKTDGRDAKNKEREQYRLLRSADLVLAVGPLLLQSAMTICQGSCEVQMIVPGLANIEPITDRGSHFRGITFGRLNAEEDRLKQGELAMKSFGRFVRRAQDAHLNRDFRLNVIGLSSDTYNEENARAKELVASEARRTVNVVAIPYQADRKLLFDDLRQNEVAMMLSWQEGFGLAGWEAIAAKVPLVVSKNSGLFNLLQQESIENHVRGVDIRGSAHKEHSDLDADSVSNELLYIASNFEEVLARASNLRTNLAKKYTWEFCARTALDALIR